jgi:hypothetical protein
MASTRGSIESSPQHHHRDGGPSDNSQAASEDIEEDDRKPPTLQVVAIHHHRYQHPNQHSNTDDNRSLSSQKSESGYHSSGAFSDGAVAAYTTTSSIRSVGSVGSYEAAQQHQHYHQAAIMFSAETRYSLAAVNSYAASEAAKSDIATVCSGSVTEDIEISSIDGGTMSSALPNNIVPSPHSERVVMVGTAAHLRNRSVEFAPSSFTASFHKQYSAAAAAYNHATHPQQFNQQQASSPAGERGRTPSPLTAAAHQAVADCDLAAMNDMGPPLSRALLMQSLQSSNSRPGSVKSYGSNGASQTSDVVAYVDTDDCGGSLMESVTDGQSIHSQEDVCRTEEETEPMHGDGHHESNGVHSDQENDGELPMNDGTHPFLKNCPFGEYSNGRTSPGGTIYKGKGVRRYQGRYMNLPLKRFQQENAGADLLDTVLEADKVMQENKRRAIETPQNGYGYHHNHDDDWRRRSESPPLQRNGRYSGGHASGHSPERRYRGRGRSPSPARQNGYHRGESNGYHQNTNGTKNGYHHESNGYHQGTGNGAKNGYHHGETNGYHKNDNGVKNGHHHGETNGYHKSNGNGVKNGYHHGETNGHHKNGNGMNGNNGNHHSHNNNGYSSSRRNRSRSRSRSRSKSPPEARRSSRRRRRNRDGGSPRRRGRSNRKSSSPSGSPDGLDSSLLSPRRRRRQSSQSGRSRS